MSPRSHDSNDRRRPPAPVPAPQDDLAAATSTPWPESSGPWGTPGNHLTGPIPRIRKRPDGTLTHGEES